MIREIVRIDEERCDGCGLCVPACEEGAIRIVDGKARIVSDQLCDGMGACLGHCPQDAITIERREADPFSEEVVEQYKQRAARPVVNRNLSVMRPPGIQGPPSGGGGCPGSRAMQFESAPRQEPSAPQGGEPPSALSHWPVQLRLLSPDAPVLRQAHVLVAADCVPVAYAGFQEQLLRGRAVVIACPKLDDTRGYVEKLAHIIRTQELASIKVARMEVPCCMGIVQAVLQACQLSGREVPVSEVIIGIRGDVISKVDHFPQGSVR